MTEFLPGTSFDRRLRLAGCVVAWAGLAASLLLGAAAAQTLEIGQQRHTCNCARDAPIPINGEVRALVVFLKFADDTFDSDCMDGYVAWPSSAPVPDYAKAMLAPARDAPVPDSSLTRFFLQQSNGTFHMTGRAVGYTTAQPASAYRSRRGASNRLDHGAVAREALTALDDAIDYRDFDANGDGYVDQVFFVVRRLGSMYLAMRNADGVSSLGYSAAPGGEALDGVGVCSECSGSFNRHRGMDPMRSTISLLAHEFGHDLFGNRRFFNHLSPIVGNGVPLEPRADSLGARYADRTTGYALMLGIGSQTHEAYESAFMSAFERDLLSLTAPDPAGRWIDCRALTRDTTVTLRDLVRTGDCVRLIYEQAPPGDGRPRATTIEALYLSNLQQGTFFTSPTVTRTFVSSSCPGCRAVEAGGPHDTGLLVERTQRRDAPPFGVRRDLVPADNGLRAMQTCAEVTADEGPSAADVFDGDLWDPDVVRQLTPWTRPSSFGTTHQHQAPPALRAGAWPAFDAFRYANARYGDASVITFDYIRDLRRAPLVPIREPSWIDAGSDDLVLDGQLVVTEGATLVLEDSVAVGVRRGVVVEAGATLRLQPGSRLRLGEGAAIRVAGRLEADRATFGPLEAGGAWRGIERVGAGHLELGASRLEGTP